LGAFSAALDSHNAHVISRNNDLSTESCAQCANKNSCAPRTGRFISSRTWHTPAAVHLAAGATADYGLAP
jgi:hypothetical protein